MHHNPEKNVLWIAIKHRSAREKTGAWTKRARASLLARAKGKLLAARRERRPTPAIDQTLYVGWNSMFVSAYLEAARVLDRPDCRDFALKTLDRILAEAWDPSKGFLHRVGGPRLEGSLDDQVFATAALLDAYEATLDRRYFEIAERAMHARHRALSAIPMAADSSTAPRTPRRWAASTCAASRCRIRPRRARIPSPHRARPAARFYWRKLYREWAEKTLEAFVGLIPQYGLFAATYGLAALLHARHPMQVIVTGATGDPTSRRARKSRA